MRWWSWRLSRVIEVVFKQVPRPFPGLFSKGDGWFAIPGHNSLFKSSNFGRWWQWHRWRILLRVGSRLLKNLEVGLFRLVHIDITVDVVLEYARFRVAVIEIMLPMLILRHHFLVVVCWYEVE